jgi:hypothetical protein
MKKRIEELSWSKIIFESQATFGSSFRFFGVARWQMGRWAVEGAGGRDGAWVLSFRVF